MDRIAHKEPLFELINLPSRLVIDKVYANSFHSLRAFQIKNLTNTQLLIKLKSNISSQLQFTSSNQNLTTDLIDLYQSNVPYIVSNTVDSALVNNGFANGLGGIQFCQVVNSIDKLLEEVILGSLEIRTIILLFQPDLRKKRPKEIIDNGLSFVDFENEKYEFQDVNGIMFFFAYLADDRTSAGLECTPLPIQPATLVRNVSIYQDMLPLESPSTNLPDFQVLILIAFIFSSIQTYE